MKISELPEKTGTLPSKSYAIIAIMNEDKTYENYKVDLSNLSVTGTGGGSTSGDYVTRTQVQQMINDAISGPLEQVAANLQSILGDE